MEARHLIVTNATQRLAFAIDAHSVIILIATLNAQLASESLKPTTKRARLAHPVITSTA